MENNSLKEQRLHPFYRWMKKTKPFPTVTINAKQQSEITMPFNFHQFMNASTYGRWGVILQYTAMLNRPDQKGLMAI
jgi:hypothetical protein